MTTMPPELSFGYVTGRFILAVADAGDADRTPDAVPASGMTVKITPKQQIVRIGGAAPVLVAKQPITCTVDGDGYLLDPEGAPGVWLVTGVYSVAYSSASASIPAHDIEVLDTHTEATPLDLVNAMPPGGPVLTASQYAELSARIDALGTGGGGGEGTQGPPGEDGASAYEVAVANGFVGTEVEWLASLEGPEGAAGADGADGAPGDSAYQVALDNGFVGTEAEWLASLEGPEGPKGDPGTDGTDGQDGADGDSAYEVAVAEGFVGTEAEWLESLVGPEGPQGPQGDPGTDGTDGQDGVGIPQTLSLSGSDLTLSDGGGTVTLPSGGGAVDSVNGQTGAVVLDAADVDALPDTYTPPPTAWGSIPDKPATFPPADHTHDIADVSGLQDELDGKAATGHSHTQTDVLGLASALTDRAQVVVVTTGSETRPTGSTVVFWVGGTTQPANMSTGDLWFGETA